MSNQYRQNRYEGNKGFTKGQKKFIAKATSHSSSSRDSNPSQTLSNALRQSLSRQSDAASSSSSITGGVTGRVKLGGDGKWVSGGVKSGNFVNYLPQDEAVAAGLGPDEGGLDPVESQRVVDLLNRELSRLLKLNPREFWKEVASDTSLHDFVESFLKFRSRWYDFPYRGPKGIVAGVIVGENELSRRVFMVLYRISSNRDPNGRDDDCLRQRDHAVLLQEKKLLDLPKLLDICAIYGYENEDLTRLMVVNVIKAQPSIHEDITSVVSQFQSISSTMYERCSSSLEVLLASHGHQGHGSVRLHSDYLEVMDFLNDAIVSMDAFVSAYNHAAVLFSCPVEMSYGNEEMLNTLAKLHDSLLPPLLKGFHLIFAERNDGHQDKMFSNILISIMMLSNRLVNFGWRLLYFCYLSDEIFEDCFSFPAVTKIFPAQLEDPVIRADIIVQTFREINAGSSPLCDSMGCGTFFQNIEKSHKVMGRIESLRNKGWIAVDDEQLQFLSVLMQPLKSNTTEKPVTKGHVSSSGLQRDEDAAILESKISQIKDIFPDYGKGFLTACLEVYNQNPEEVIQRILEGTLHEDLRSLDTSLETIQPSKPALSGNMNDKGKGKMLEYSEPTINTVYSVKEQGVEGPSVSSSSLVGRFIRKSSADLPDSSTLDSRDTKDMAKTAALISQLEYEDEYDDSFDELGLSVADSGLDETEMSSKTNSYHDKAWEGERGSKGTNTPNSKWNSQKKPQFFVKDGKNYSYKVDGSVAVANYNEATLVNQVQKELIHGLGRGGNIPLGAVKRFEESKQEHEDETEDNGMGRGRADRGGFRGRGRGGGRNNYRKDRAMKKHFSGLAGY